MLEQLIRAMHPAIAQALAESMLAAQIVAIAEVLAEVPVAIALPAPAMGPPGGPPTISTLLPPASNEPHIRFPVVDDALEVLREAPVFSARDFRQTADAVREGAFAITGDFTDDVIYDVKQLLVENIARGPDLDAFVAEASKVIELSQPRLEMVFRNNVGRAFAEGADRALANPVVVDAFPYRLYRATHDARCRKDHRSLETQGLDGTAVYRADDPVWRELRPPWDWGCRCSFAPLTIRQASRLGVTEATDWLDRAQRLAMERGGSASHQLAAAAPLRPQHVQWPTYNGERIMPPAEWRGREVTT